MNRADAIFPYYSIGDFINEPDNPTQFEITRFEDMSEPEVDDIHKHTFYEILWVDEGESRQFIDFKEFELRAGSLFFIAPGQVHKFEEWRPLKGGTIMFTPDYYLLNKDASALFNISYLDQSNTNPLHTPDKNSFSEIRSTIDHLEREHRRKDVNDSIRQSLLHVLIEQLQRSYRQDDIPEVNRTYVVIFKRFRELIETHYLENPGVSFYADELNITQHHLNRICRTLVNKTATTVARDRQLLEVQRLLAFTDLTITEIAAELGIFDSSYLAKQFRKQFGSSPTDFRVRMSEKYRMD